MKKQRPSELELQVLSVLWDKGPSTVREVLEAAPDGKKRAYTTMLTVLQVMEKKGLVTRSKDGVAHVFRARLKPESVLRPFMQGILRNVFGGKPSAALQYLLDERAVDDDELEAVRRLIDERERDAGRGRPKRGKR